jgi:hypothetical protein
MQEDINTLKKGDIDGRESIRRLQTDMDLLKKPNVDRIQAVMWPGARQQPLPFLPGWVPFMVITLSWLFTYIKAKGYRPASQ